MVDTFQMLNGEDKMLDSMCYDSGEIICSYGNDNEYVRIAIRGDVRVIYKNESFRYFTNMPEELQQLFIKGDYEKLNEVAEIVNNNWPEYEYIKDGVYVDGDYFETNVPVSKEELEQDCKFLLEEFRKEKNYGK